MIADFSDSRKMLTVQQVAERMAVSQASVYRLIETGRLLAHRVGIGRGTIRISEQQLDKYLLETKTEVPQKLPQQKKQNLRHIQF